MRKALRMSVKSNFIYNVAYQILLIVLPLVTAPFLSRILGASQLGEYSYTYSVANYFVLFAMLGVNNYGNRCVARVRSDRAKLSSEFWSVYCLQAFATFIVFILYVVYSFALSGDIVLAFIWAPYVLSAGMDVNWFFFGLEEFRFTVARNFVIKLATFALTLLLVRGEHALIIYCALLSLSSLVSAMALWPFIWRKVDWVRPTKQQIILHLRPNLVLFVPVVAISLYTVLDKVMLGWLSSFEENGYFENAYKVATMPTAVITALGTVMLPRVANLLAQGRQAEAHRYLGTSMWTASVMAFAFSFGVAGVAPVLVPVLFGEGFGPSEISMCVIVADMPFMAWANVIRTQLLIPEGRDREYVASVIAGAAINVAVNLALVPSCGALGASIGTFCAEGLVCVVQAWSVRGEVPQARWVLLCLPYAAIGFIMFVIVRVMGDVMGLSALTLLVQVFTGTVTYSLLSLAWCALRRDDVYLRVVQPALKGAVERLRDSKR